MNLANVALLEDFAKRHAKSAAPLARWKLAASAATWKSFAEVRAAFPSVDMVKPHTLIFNIGGNHYRLVVKATFSEGLLKIEGVYTHAEYDKLNLR